MKTLFTNARIFTSNPGQLYADSMLAEDGKILWVGTGAPEENPDEVVDLQGRTVIPGLVDAHMHPLMLAEYSKQIACLPPTVNSIEDLVGEIARVRQELIDSGETAEKADPDGDTDGKIPWIRGWGYDEGKYAEKRSPNRYDLDRGSKDFPVFLVRSCEHIRCVNSKALEIAGIT